MKSAQNYLAEANAAVARIDPKLAVEIHAQENAVFVDVRDSAAIAETGTIKNAHCVPRGFIEFAADENTPYHVEALRKDAEIYLVCGAGGQAALAGKTLIEMGYTNVTNLGGIGDWIKNNGPVQSV